MEYNVIQDGADFYLMEKDELVAVIVYPNKVRDFDLERAKRARAWFNELMRKWNFTVSF